MLDNLESGKAKLIYYFIEQNETVTLDDIRNELDMKAITVYPILRNLADENLIEKTDYRYRVQ